MTAGPRVFGITGRIAVVVLYGIVAFLLANRFGANPPRPAPAVATPTAQPPNETSHLKIDVFASRTVTRWSIRLDGTMLTPHATSATSWSGEFAGPLPAGSRLVLDIEPRSTEDEAPLAVRLRIEGETGQIDRTFWSDSDLVEAVPLELLRTPKGDTP